MAYPGRMVALARRRWFENPTTSWVDTYFELPPPIGWWGPYLATIRPHVLIEQMYGGIPGQPAGYWRVIMSRSIDGRDWSDSIAVSFDQQADTGTAPSQKILLPWGVLTDDQFAIHSRFGVSVKSQGAVGGGDAPFGLQMSISLKFAFHDEVPRFLPDQPPVDWRRARTPRRNRALDPCAQDLPTVATLDRLIATRTTPPPSDPETAPLSPRAEPSAPATCACDEVKP